MTGKGFRPRMFPLGRGQPLAFAALIFYFLLSVVAPLLILLWMSLMPYQTGLSWAALKLITLENHLDFLRNPRVSTATRNSLVIAVVAATGVSVLSLLLSWLTTRLRVPGLAGARYARLHSDRRSRRDDRSGADLRLYRRSVRCCRSTARSGSSRSPTHAISAVRRARHQRRHDAAPSRSSRKPAPRPAPAALRILRRITLPLVWPAVAAVWIWVLAHALRELSSALLLQGRDNKVIPTLLWDYWSGGEPNRTAAGGLWLTVALMLFLVLWRSVARRAGLERAR